MILTASRGKAFKEDFTFRNEKGLLMTAPTGSYVLTLERGNFVKTYTNLSRARNSITWNMAAADTEELEYETMYFSLTHNGTEIARGVLRVQ